MYNFNIYIKEIMFYFNGKQRQKIKVECEESDDSSMGFESAQRNRTTFLNFQLI